MCNWDAARGATLFTGPSTRSQGRNHNQWHSLSLANVIWHFLKTNPAKSRQSIAISLTELKIVVPFMQNQARPRHGLTSVATRSTVESVSHARPESGSHQQQPSHTRRQPWDVVPAQKLPIRYRARLIRCLVATVSR
jgi:hypothetical protein